MSEDRHKQILSNLEIEAQQVREGKIKVEFTIHNGKLSVAEIIEERKRL